MNAKGQPSVAPGRRGSIGGSKVGASFAGQVHHMTIERVLTFSGGPISQATWPDCNLHTDVNKAREAGLSGIIVSATQFEGHLLDLLIELFGDEWFGMGTIEMKIPKSLMLNDSVQAKAVLREIRKQAAGQTYMLDVTCENQHGEPVLVGSASCFVAGGSDAAKLGRS